MNGSYVQSSFTLLSNHVYLVILHVYTGSSNTSLNLQCGSGLIWNRSHIEKTTWGSVTLTTLSMNGGNCLFEVQGENGLTVTADITALLLKY